VDDRGLGRFPHTDPMLLGPLPENRVLGPRLVNEHLDSPLVGNVQS
jgi:hypothetical protein